MLAQIMFILQALRRFLHIRIDHLAARRHLGNLLEYNRVVNRLMRILAPGKRSMVLAEHTWHRHRVELPLLKQICNQHACVPLIIL